MSKKSKKAKREKIAKRKEHQEKMEARALRHGRRDRAAAVRSPSKTGGSASGEAIPPGGNTGGLFPKSDASVPCVPSQETAREGPEGAKSVVVAPMTRRKKQTQKEDSEYIAPKELVARWRCARSSVDRIARRAGMTRVCLGEGKNGIVRYIREEVLAYEKSKKVRM